MEAIFDAGYLIFDLIAGILFFVFSKGNPLFILYGVLTLTLCGIGLQISSITMTVFYIILLYVWKLTFPELNAPAAVEAIIWISAIIISFGCYLPVTLFSKTKPKVGLLMIPKTCAYMWIIAMGLHLLF